MKVCVACQENVAGRKAVKVKEDRIIRTIRRVKRALGIAQMNELYVCEDDLKEHMKRRRSFEKSILFASVLAGIILLLVLAMLLLSGRFDAWAIVSAFIIGAFVLALPLFKYTPAVQEGAAVALPSSAANPKAAKKKPAKRKAAGRKKR